MNKLNKTVLLLFTVIISAISSISCESDITGLNVDPKHPTTIPSGNLVASAQQTLMAQLMTANANRNIARFFTQQWSQTTYLDESNYDMVNRPIPRNHYNTMMASFSQTANSEGVLSALRDAKKFLDTETVTAVDKNNKLATIELLNVFAWANLVDSFGDIPYSEALKAEQGILSPKYDDAETIYNDLFKRIDAALAMITTGSSGYTTDIIYRGDMSKWKKMGNSLKFKLALNIADKNPALSKSMAEAAYNTGLFIDMADSFGLSAFPSGQFANPVYMDVIASGRDDFIPSDVLVNFMNTNNDPRRGVWFTQVGGAYKGGVYGANNTFDSYSHFTPVISGQNAQGYLMDHTEISFLRAEAAARGYSVGGTKEVLYANAVTASMTEYGLTSADATTYLIANPLNPTNWKKSIGEQAWVAMFNKGYQAWNFTRRLDFPKFVNPPNSTVESVPIRMRYSDQEFVLNGPNVKAAVAKLAGGDKVSSKIFWDVN